MRQRDPHEDKVRSYQHDQRNRYGENDKSSRKSIRFRKAWVNRTYRRAVRQQLDEGRAPETLEDEAESVRRKPWRKWRDEPLGQVIEERHGRRGVPDGTKASSARSEAIRRLRKSGKLP